MVRPGSENLRYLPSDQDGLVIIERELGELDTLDQVIDEPCQLFTISAGTGPEARTDETGSPAEECGGRFKGIRGSQTFRLQPFSL